MTRSHGTCRSLLGQHSVRLSDSAVAIKSDFQAALCWKVTPFPAISQRGQEASERLKINAIWRFKIALFSVLGCLRSLQCHLPQLPLSFWSQRSKPIAQCTWFRATLGLQREGSKLQTSEVSLPEAHRFRRSAKASDEANSLKRHKLPAKREASKLQTKQQAPEFQTV